MGIKTLLTALVLPLLALAQNTTQTPGALPTIVDDGPIVRSDGKYVIQSEGITAYAIPYAATISNLFIKDVHNVTRDIVLGYVKNATRCTIIMADKNQVRQRHLLHEIQTSPSSERRSWTLCE